MDFSRFEAESRFREAWEAVKIVRPVHYSLFTFGESILPYFLVRSAERAGDTVSVTRGDVRITRPMIITPDSARPEFKNFFESQEEERLIDFLLARTAAFSHLQFDNSSGPAGIVSDSDEEVIATLNRQLDAEEEDQIAILSSPPDLGGIALLRYAIERVQASAPDNLQELRERGFLP